jgi:transposase
MARHNLTDDQWECIEHHIPKPKKTGRPPADRRQMVNAILWIVRTGAPWRDLPAEFGPWQTVYEYFNQWSSDGTLAKILRSLQRAMSDTESFDHDLWCIDGTVVRAARCAAGGGKKTTHASRKITRSAVLAGVSPRKSTSSATGKVTHCTSN